MGLVRRLFTLAPDNDAIRVRLYVQPSGERWAAMVPGDTCPPPGPDELRGQGFFGDTADAAEQFAQETSFNLNSVFVKGRMPGLFATGAPCR